MLSRLQVSNFKAWQETDLKFGKVTGFFGTNSAGKSKGFADQKTLSSIVVTGYQGSG